MKKAFKKAISVLLVAVMMLGTAPLAGFVGFELPDIFEVKAEATTDGYYSYSVSDGEATIKGVDKSISGDIVIPSTLGGYPVTSIDDSAFDNCSSLTSVTIPDSVTTIGSGAFSYCISLEKAYYTGDIAGWCAIEFVSSKSNPVCYAKKLYINGVLIKDLVIPEGVTSIGDYAFYGYTSLTSVIIPDSVTSIGNSAFFKCTSLERVTIPDGVTFIDRSTFDSCTGLTSVTIPKTVTSIEYCAFNNCEALKDVYYGGSKSNWENVAINKYNSGIFLAKIHYNSTGPDGGSTEIPDNTPGYDSSVVDTFLVATPTETIISYGDSIVLHIDPSKIPEGGRVEWYASNENFTYSVSSFGTTCTISPSKSGDTTFTAIVYDAQSNIVSADNQEMTSKSGFFDKFIAFFKKLFGLTKTIPEAIKSI